MAAGTLPGPGTKLGPCADRCAHLDCNETRGMAHAHCHYCEKQIGYNVRFYREPASTHPDLLVLTDTAGERYVLVHADCAERIVEVGAAKPVSAPKPISDKAHRFTVKTHVRCAHCNWERRPGENAFLWRDLVFCSPACKGHYARQHGLA